MDRSHRYYAKHKEKILEKAKLKLENETDEQREARLEKRRQQYANKKTSVLIIEHNIKVDW
jgi:hypothetical protein